MGSEHVLSILVKALGATKAAKDLKNVDTAVGRIGATAQRGISTAAGNLAKLGLIAGAGLGAAVKSGINDLAELEDATAQVDGAIRQLGQTGQVSASQVAGWANDIEASIGAAFDDKAITSATATLIRFGSVTPKNLRPAMVVMTDLAAKTGDVDSAATLLAKALADPAKAAGKLARQGIVLTKVQQDNIKALVKAGKVEQAQAVLLGLIAEKTKGAAAATQGPYRRALSVLADVSEDAKKALAEGFLPVLERVAGVLSKKLADPKVIADIRTLGKGLADGFDKALSAAEKIPWGTIGDSMKLAGTGAKAALDLFTGLPPWVQTAVITGWGLNKLTGGAVGGIVGELGKGLIKGVLGMQAGVVNIQAGIVNGGGLPTGPASGPSAAGNAFKTAATAVAVVVTPVAATVGANSVLNAAIPDMGVAQSNLERATARAEADRAAAAKGTTTAVRSVEDQIIATRDAASRNKDDLTAVGLKQVAALNATRDKVEANRIVTASAAAQAASAQASLRAEVESAGILARSGGLSAASAIDRKKMSYSTTFSPIIKTYVSVRETINTRTTYKQFQKTAS